LDPPRTVKYKVKMEVAPLERCDGMRWSRLFNLLGTFRAGPTKEAGEALEIEARSFGFSTTLSLRVPDGAPEPIASNMILGTSRTGDILSLRFQPNVLRRDHAVPAVTIEQVVLVRPFVARSADDPRTGANAFIGATDAWPADEAKIRQAVVAALGAERAPAQGVLPSASRERIETILAWTRAHVRFGGPDTGSRYGVAKVLDQGFGHCWDVSDVFITLCRTARIPARQVGGWLRGVDGHVWAEVWIEGEGWLEVDPGTSWLGVSEDYVPLWASDDGRAPLVYWGAPEISVQGDSPNAN
jgi:transglutaminase-like putative cysteine protease